jgi:hypothetical protein
MLFSLISLLTFIILRRLIFLNNTTERTKDLPIFAKPKATQRKSMKVAYQVVSGTTELIVQFRVSSLPGPV